MTIKDEDQVRAWCVDYALRTKPVTPRTKPESVIAYAKKFEAYITARPACEITLLPAKRKNRP
ncbi:hypothetical protein [Zavarzinella formosa]|uniref:hypothetical protein n=1 Tax=Zavarzinella formosa TaxID=360055 RepID=UPI000308E9F6|nr:hypothetical protein [Zavarzinella formosa]